jgi:hypothetical protein
MELAIGYICFDAGLYGTCVGLYGTGDWLYFVPVSGYAYIL